MTKSCTFKIWVTLWCTKYTFLRFHTILFILNDNNTSVLDDFQTYGPLSHVCLLHSMKKEFLNFCVLMNKWWNDIVGESKKTQVLFPNVIELPSNLYFGKTCLSWITLYYLKTCDEQLVRHFSLQCEVWLLSYGPEMCTLMRMLPECKVMQYK